MSVFPRVFCYGIKDDFRAAVLELLCFSIVWQQIHPEDHVDAHASTSLSGGNSPSGGRYPS